MYRYLDVEQPSNGLNREESISATARRQALSIVFHDDDDSSGILEHKILPPSPRWTTSLRSDNSHDDKLVERKKKALTASNATVPTGTSPNTSVEEKLIRKGHLAMCIQVVDDARDRLEKREVTITRRGLEHIELGSIDTAPPAFRRHSAHRNQVQQPGAYREGGRNDLRTITLQRNQSEGSLRTTASNPRLREVLVDAELVSLSNRSRRSRLIEFQKSVFVEASLVDESEQLPHASFVTVIKTNRKVQIAVCIIILALLAMALATSLVLLIGRDSKALASVASEPIFSPTTSPTSNNEGFLMQVLKSNLPFSSILQLDDVESSQYKAMEWLQKDANVTTYSEERLLQRFVLAQFFYSTGGQTIWAETDGWLSDTHECSWYTSSTEDSICNNDTLIRFSLYRNGLGGTLPDELGLLTNLVDMQLGTNSMVGSIPPVVLSQLTNLQSLWMSANLMYGTVPTEIGLLTKLTDILLYNNGIVGTLPTELGFLTNAVRLHLFDQSLEGTIPTEIGRCTNLESLWLWMNKLSGAIPSEIGHLSNLLKLPLHDNALFGTIPTELGKLVHLKWVELQRNALTGPIPAELGNLKDITLFNVGNNTLTGSIPTELMQPTNLFFLSVYSNRLTGHIPTEIGQLVMMEKCYLDINNLSGTLPSELGRLQVLNDFWANDNGLTGSVPDELCAIQSGILINIDCWALNCSCLGSYETSYYVA